MSGPLSNPYMFKSAAGAGDFYTHQIANSIRLYRGGDNSGSKLTRTPSSTGTSRRIYTLSTWIKRGNSGQLGQLMTAQESSSTNYVDELVIRASGENEALAFYGKGGNAGGASLKTNASLRDHSAWYHIMVAVDTTQGTDTNRVKIYINGELQTLASTTYPAQNYDGGWGNNREMAIGWGTGANNGYPYDGLMAETIYIDGTAQAVTDLGESKNGVWIPKDPSGLTFGDNGFWLKYESSSDLGNDSSGNNNDFSVTNISAHDQMLDSPTFGSSSSGNFSTGNPLNNPNSSSFAEGNTQLTAGVWTAAYCNFEVPVTGSWYWECISSNHVYGYPGVQTVTTEANQQNHDFVAVQTGEYRYEGSGEANTSSIGTGDIIAFWVNNGVIKVYVNNSLDHTFGTNMASSTNASKTFFPSWIGNASGIFNFGQDGTFAGNKTAGGNADANGYGNFMYTPKGLALCSGNLPVADAVDPAQTDDNYPQKLFSPLLYTGNGSSRSITGLGFQPDLVWLKNRETDTGQKLYDSSRGAGEAMYPHNTDAEQSVSGLSAFDSDGFSIGSTATGYNDNNDDFVSWNWRANGGTTSSNATGDITSTVQADPSGGFSIFTYTGSGSSGDTVAHGLSQAPTMTIIKQRNSTNGWNVWATGYNSGDYDSFGELNATGAWNANQGANGPFTAAPSATLLTLTAYGQVNGSSNTYVGYAFSDIDGYIKVGKYDGNGSTNGTFVYTGFKPAFMLMKRYNRSGDFWYLLDATRNPFNGPGMQMLNADGTIIESSHGTTNVIDILSNGWKMRTSGSGLNGSGGEWVFLAMAHNPFKYATAR